MPTYDYRCRKCEHEWELFQSIKADPVKKCPACGKASAQRVIGAGAGVIFRGSGFYQTDYRSDRYKQAAAADAKSSGGDSSKSDGGGQASKPESSTKPSATAKE